jgi:hypothetical protein
MKKISSRAISHLNPELTQDVSFAPKGTNPSLIEIVHPNRAHYDQSVDQTSEKRKQSASLQESEDRERVGRSRRGEGASRITEDNRLTYINIGIHSFRIKAGTFDSLLQT